MANSKIWSVFFKSHFAVSVLVACLCACSLSAAQKFPADPCGKAADKSKLPGFGTISLALDAGYFGQVKDAENLDPGVGGARQLLRIQDWQQARTATAELLVGVRDLSADGEDSSAQRLDGGYTLVTAFYRVPDAEGKDWEPLTLNEAGFVEQELQGKAVKTGQVKASSDAQSYVALDLGLVGQLDQELPSTFIDFKVAINRKEDQFHYLGSSSTSEYKFRMQRQWFPYQMFGKSVGGLWVPIALFDVHEAGNGAVSLDPAPVSLALGAKRYFRGDENYLGFSAYGNLGNHSAGDLFGGGATTFSFVSFGLLLDVSNYAYAGFAVERDLTSPTARGAAVITLAPGLLQLLKSGK
jgi:hypothetical protein